MLVTAMGMGAHPFGAATDLGLIDLGNDRRGGEGRLNYLRSGKITLPAYSMLALAFIGIAVALYVAHGNYTGQSLWCPILDGCNAVVNSPYSRVFGVPMSYLGFIYFLYMFALAVRLVFQPFAWSFRFRSVPSVDPGWCAFLF